MQRYDLNLGLVAAAAAAILMGSSGFAAERSERSFRVDIANGIVPKEQRTMRVEKGDRVRFVVASDGPGELHVHGYREKGNINTPMELAMLNETSRFHLVIDVIDWVPRLRSKAAHLKEEMRNAIIDNMRYAHEHGTDRPEIADWTWPY